MSKSSSFGSPSGRSRPSATVVPMLHYPAALEAASWLCRCFAFVVHLRIGTHRVQLEVGEGAVVVTTAANPEGAALTAGHSIMRSSARRRRSLQTCNPSERTHHQPATNAAVRREAIHRRRPRGPPMDLLTKRRECAAEFMGRRAGGQKCHLTPPSSGQPKSQLRWLSVCRSCRTLDPQETSCSRAAPRSSPRWVLGVGRHEAS